MTSLETRVQALEDRAAAMEARLRFVELEPPRATAPAARPLSAGPEVPFAAAASVAPPAVPAAPAGEARPPAAVGGRSEPPPATARPSLEDLLGGRVLAWVGGVAVAVGVILLLAIATSRGWIGEGARTGMAALASLGLLLLGAYLHERRGRTDAALAAAAAGVVGLFASLTVAGAVYELIPALAALVLALVVGAVATVLAIRWEEPGFGALGIGGALAAPVLVGADMGDPRTVALVGVAAASATGVLLRQRWTWLAYATFAICTPQWLSWLASETRPELAIVVVLAGFGALNVLATVGVDRQSRLHAIVLLALNALVLGLAGAVALDDAGGEVAGKLWLAGLAAVHVAGALAGARSARASRELALAAAALGAILADVAFAAFADGPVLALGWAALGAAFAAWRAATPADRIFRLAGCGGHLGLALWHALAFDAPPRLLGDAAPAALLALAAVAAACVASARLVGRREWRVGLDATAMAVVAYFTAMALDGPALAAAWAVQAAALGALARSRRDGAAAGGALAFLGLAGLYVTAALAPPAALLDGLADPVGAAIGLLAFTAAAASLGIRGLPLDDPKHRPALLAMAAVAVLHLASTELVTLVELGSAQRGQTVLSGFWALCGVTALVAGLMRDIRALRLGALALLGITVGKVFLYDLASLTSLYRVASFIALGLLLLCGAFAWQRLRPRDPAGSAMI